MNKCTSSVTRWHKPIEWECQGEDAIMVASMAHFDLVAIGDSTLDRFLLIHEATVTCSVNKSACSLCMEYAEKIPLERIVNIPGAGNASNAAIGASRLGMNTAIVSVIGNDESGRAVLKQWDKEDVNTSLVQVDKKHPSNESIVLSFQGERTILTHAEPHAYKLPRLPETDWIYYTALGAGHEKLESSLLAHLDKHSDTHLLFNPGTTQLRRGLAAISPVIERSTVFVVNKEEAQKLLGEELPHPRDLALPFLRMGAEIVVITDGAKGSFATTQDEAWVCPIFPGEVIERTGAGDSFATAFLVALHEGKPIPEAMRWGTANSTSVVKYIGPQEGLLTSASLKKSLTRHSSIKPKYTSYAR